jgi:hypothetical protein
VRVNEGGGIAGCSVAHFLACAGKRVAIVERHHLASGTSGVAGAFVNPVVAAPTAWNVFVNQSFSFTLALYLSIAAQCVNRKGVIKMKPSRVSWDDFWRFEKFITLPYKKESSGYFFPDGSVVEPRQLCAKLTENIASIFNNIELDIIYTSSSSSRDTRSPINQSGSDPIEGTVDKRRVFFDHTKGKWICDDLFETQILILCTGNIFSLSESRNSKDELSGIVLNYLAKSLGKFVYALMDLLSDCGMVMKVTRPSSRPSPT